MFYSYQFIYYYLGTKFDDFNHFIRGKETCNIWEIRSSNRKITVNQDIFKYTIGFMTIALETALK